MRDWLALPGAIFLDEIEGPRMSFWMVPFVLAVSAGTIISLAWGAAFALAFLLGPETNTELFARFGQSDLLTVVGITALFYAYLGWCLYRRG